MREPGPVFLYDDLDGDGSDVIASVYFDVPDNPKRRVATIEVVITTDREQAERWRSLLAAGETPDLSADPPIVDVERILAASPNRAR